MISDYVFKWNLDNEIDNKFNLEAHRIKLFELSVNRLSGTFSFNIDGIQTHEDSTFLLQYKKETDWLFKPEDRTFNLFYPFNTHEADMVVVYKNEAIGIKIEKNYLYCLPYWMTYKFLSANEEFNQELINIKLETVNRPKLKIKDTLW